MIVSNSVGVVTSATATLTVTPLAQGLCFAPGTNSGLQFSQVLLPVQVSGFTNIVSFQGSLHWDTNVAAFVDVEQFGLPGLAAGSFGTALASGGTLTVSWDDPLGTGQSLADGTTVFALRFTLTGSVGAATAITMDGVPTALEAANNDFVIMPAQAVAGQLSVVETLAIRGRVFYYPSNPSPSGFGDNTVPGVVLTLNGGLDWGALSANDGSYRFGSVGAGLDYEVSAGQVR